MLVWIASQCSHLELSAGLKSTHNAATLLPRCANDGDQFLVVQSRPSYILRSVGSVRWLSTISSRDATYLTSLTVGSASNGGI